MKTQWHVLRAAGVAAVIGFTLATQSFAQSCRAPCDMGAGPEVNVEPVPNFGAASAQDTAAPYMLGDYLNAGISRASGLGFFDAVNPHGVRSFKIADNNSAQPADRIYFNYNWWEGVGGASLIGRTQFGAEKTFGDGRSSVGVTLPVYFADPARDSFGFNTFGMGGKQADFGDLVLVFKRAVSVSPQGDYITVGAALQMPTGPATIADVDAGSTQADHDGSFQPYVAVLHWLGQGFFFQYFGALDVPFEKNDATIMFNDIQIGHFMSTGRSSGITALIPTFELHANDPLNNRPIADDTGVNIMTYKDQVNVTSGIIFELNRRSTLQFGLSAPIASVNGYDYELIAQLNVFGGNRPFMRRY